MKFEYASGQNWIPEAVRDYARLHNTPVIHCVMSELSHKDKHELIGACYELMKADGDGHNISLDTSQVPYGFDRSQQNKEQSIFFCERYFIGLFLVAGELELKKTLKRELGQRGLDDAVVNLEKEWDPRDQKWKFAATYQNGGWHLATLEYNLQAESNFQEEVGSEEDIQKKKYKFLNPS